VFSRNLPWTMIVIGALVAVAIIMWDKWLEARDSSFRAPVLAVAVGIYLPIELSVPIFIGGLIAYFAARAKARANASKGADEPESQKGLLFASGLITGEALVGIFLAIPFAVQEDADALALTPDMLGLSPSAFAGIEQTFGVVLFIGFCVWLYRVAKS